jgi:hypothetical protein
MRLTCGSLAIIARFSGGGYNVAILRGNGRIYETHVMLPAASFPFAQDTAEGRKGAARAALSFADDAGEDLDGAELDDLGWAVRQRP